MVDESLRLMPGGPAVDGAPAAFQQQQLIKGLQQQQQLAPVSGTPKDTQACLTRAHQPNLTASMSVGSNLRDTRDAHSVSKTWRHLG